MRIAIVVLGMIGIVAFYLGATTLSHALSAVHEIEGLIILVIGTIALSSAAIVTALVAVRREIAISRALPPGRS